MATYTLKNPTGAPSEVAFRFALKLVKETPGATKSARLAVLQSMAAMNAQQISDLIDLLKNPTKTAAPAPAKQAIPGHYVVNGVEYIVKVSKSTGFAYLCNNWGGYLGAKGVAAPILAEIVANGAACAIAYAKITGKCGICNTELTDPKSIAAGLGPVCAKKF